MTTVGVGDSSTISLTALSISVYFLITVFSTIALSSTIVVSSTIIVSSWFVVFSSITVSSTIVEENAIEKETEIDSRVKEIVGLLQLACRSSPDGGDVPEVLTTPTVVVDDIDNEKTSTEAFDEDQPKGDCAAKVV